MKKQPRPLLVPAICLLITGALLASCNLPGPASSQVVRDTPTATQQSLASPSASPQALSSPTASTVEPPAADCDLARFVSDVTYPDDTVVKAGEAFIKTWKIQNMGSCTWDENYKLVFIRGEQMDGPSPADVVLAPVKPGDSVELSIPLKAPPENGTHWGIWQLHNGAGNPIKKADGTPQELSVQIVIQDGIGGRVTKVQGWRYTFVGAKCGANTQYDVWTSIYAGGPVEASYVWSTTNGLLTVVSQSLTFTGSGSQEVTTHIGPPYANPANIQVTLTVNGTVQSTFTICP
jgi:hypothetical protein